MNKWIALIFISYLTSCIVIENQIEGLPSGIWRGVIKLDPTPIFSNPKGLPLEGTMDYRFQEIDAGELPFIFQISKLDNSGNQTLSFMDGDKEVRSVPLKIGRDLSTAKDTVLVVIGDSNRLLTAIFEENIMEGTFGKSKFIAWFGKDYLFTQLKKTPKIDISGSYAIQIDYQDSDIPNIGQLSIIQNGNTLDGTLQMQGFTLPLNGTIQRDKIYLSGINGKQAILLQGKINDRENIFGSYRDLDQKIGFWKITI